MVGGRQRLSVTAVVSILSVPLLACQSFWGVYQHAQSDAGFEVSCIEAALRRLDGGEIERVGAVSEAKAGWLVKYSPEVRVALSLQSDGTRLSVSQLRPTPRAGVSEADYMRAQDV